MEVRRGIGGGRPPIPGALDAESAVSRRRKSEILSSHSNGSPRKRPNKPIKLFIKRSNHRDNISHLVPAKMRARSIHFVM